MKKFWKNWLLAVFLRCSRYLIRVLIIENRVPAISENYNPVPRIKRNSGP